MTETNDMSVREAMTRIEEQRSLYRKLDELDRDYDMVASVHIEHDPNALTKWQQEWDQTTARIEELEKGGD